MCSCRRLQSRRKLSPQLSILSKCRFLLSQSFFLTLQSRLLFRFLFVALGESTFHSIALRRSRLAQTSQL